MPDDKPTTIINQRTDNFTTVYANNAYFESSAWDLKIVFGQLDQSQNPAVVKQNLAVTIPWQQAKLAIYWLQIQVAAEEAQLGAKIPIRKDLLPAELPTPTPEQQSDPNFTKWFEKARKIREEFLANV